MLLPNPAKFLTKIFKNLDNINIDVTNYELDHICYRVETVERYDFFKKELIKLGDLLSEKMINGRLISSYKLFEPIIYKERKIWVIELPSPKPNVFYKEGFEHVEFVIDISFDKFKQKYREIKFSEKAINKKINADISIGFEDCSVKFHQNSLEYVIMYLE